MKLRYFLASFLLLGAPLAAKAPSAPAATSTSDKAAPAWPFAKSDLTPDPAFHFGKLANGMRYIIRRNERPQGTALVRLYIGSGSLEETDRERGLAHFLEHMAFNGSNHVPEGEMVKLLEREGLAFGADTNASTGFEATTYKLDLPRNDPALLDTALMLMRETASDLTIAPAAVDRERGVVLSERRDRTNYALKNTLDEFSFNTPAARFTQRIPIGTEQVLNTATAADIRGYYAREYVPANAVLVVVGDFDPALVEAKIRTHFGSWAAAPMPAEPSAGPVDPKRAGLSEIYLDPALSERVTVSRYSSYRDVPDTAAKRRQDLLSSIGYQIINRRLQATARQENAPFRGAGFGTGDVFKAARVTNLVVDTADGQWAAGLKAATIALHRALEYGFSPSEVAEQLAEVVTAQKNAAASANTQSNAALTDQALQLVTDDQIPTTPQSGLVRLEAFLPYITPAAVLAALREDFASLDDPLIRFRGSVAPVGGTDALRSTWDGAMGQPIKPVTETAKAQFGYDSFGAAGKVVADTLDPRLGIREIRFANGVRLNLKQTDLQKDRVAFQVSIDGGELLNTKDDPLETAMVAVLPQGGLGKHSLDELQSILAGKSVSFALQSATDSFISRGTTTTGDLDLQLKLLAAGLIDPGYRSDAVERYHRNIISYFKQKDATPGSVLGYSLGAIISDNDPRFTLQNEARYEALDFTKLRKDIGDRLAHGALEIALVGDFDQQNAINFVAATFGALPAREENFELRKDARQRSFTTDLTPRILNHDGEADQALLQLTWPTRDASDQTEALQLKMLERVMQLELQDELRERLGKTYSPGARSDTSYYYPGFGTFMVNASVDVGDVDTTLAAIRAVVARLRSQPVDADTLARARRPLLESFDNALKTNVGLLSLVDRAQTQSDRINDFLAARGVVKQITAADIEAIAERYLVPSGALEVEVLPRPKQEGTPPSLPAPQN